MDDRQPASLAPSAALTDLLFVYGTLRRGGANHHLLSHAEFIGPARTEEWFALYIDGVPYVTRSEAVCPIIGEIYQVGGELLAELDAQEGHPHWYHREVVTVVLADGQLHQAGLYFFDKPQGRLVLNGDFFDPKT